MNAQMTIGSDVPIANYDDLEVIKQWLISPIIDEGEMIPTGRYLELGCNPTETSITKCFSEMGWEGVCVAGTKFQLPNYPKLVLVRCTPSFSLHLVLKQYPPPYDLVVINLNERTLENIDYLMATNPPRVLCVKYRSEKDVDDISSRMGKIYSGLVRTKENIIGRK